ncbi:MAG: hypothetical protein WDZ50_07455 [Woeseia sp.]
MSDDAQYRVGPSCTQTLGCFDQAGNVRRRVMRRDPIGFMPEQILAILKADAGGTKPVPDRMAKVMDPETGQTSPLPPPC